MAFLTQNYMLSNQDYSESFAGLPQGDRVPF